MKREKEMPQKRKDSNVDSIVVKRKRRLDCYPIFQDFIKSELEPQSYRCKGIYDRIYATCIRQVVNITASAGTITIDEEEARGGVSNALVDSLGRNAPSEFAFYALRKCLWSVAPVSCSRIEPP